MKINLLLLAAIVAVAVKAQDEIDSDDFPAACASVCQPLVSTTNRCDDTTDGDAAYLNCVCTSADASSLLPSCGSCIRSNNGDFDNDAIELALRCGFAIPSSTSSSGAAASTSSSVSSMSSMTSMSTMTSMTSMPSTSSPASTAAAAPTAGGNANAGTRLSASVAAVPLLLLPVVAMF